MRQGDAGRGVRAAMALALVTGAVLSVGCGGTPRQSAQHAAAVPPPPPARLHDLYVYPAQGQDEDRLDRDRYACHRWSVRQSGFDPSLPGLPPHQRVRVVAAGPPPGAGVAAGAMTGAVLGAAVSRPHETGEGALVGAAAGAVLGAIAESAHAEETGRREQALAQREAGRVAQQEQLALAYRRAITACLEGRGYSVR